MPRTRRAAIDGGFEFAGNDWYDFGDFVDFGAAGYTTFELPFSIYLGGNFIPGGNEVSTVTLWNNGVLSLGPVTQAQIDFMQSGASPAPDGENPGFPGFFFLVDHDPEVQYFSYSYGLGIADYEEPYEQSDAVSAAFFSFNNGFQIILDQNGFSIVEEADSVGRINGFFIGALSETTVGGQLDYSFYPNFLRYTGTDGADSQIGSEFNESFISSAGADVIDGQGGIDIVVYVNSVSGVSINLATGSAQGGDAEGDQLTGIEELAGTNSSDSLTGSVEANRLFGFAGNDIINGGGGDDLINGGSGGDTLSGGAGTDSLTYAGSGGGVIVSLADGTASGGDAEGDTFSGFEAVVGSDFDDVLAASAAGSRLSGEFGDDTLLGGAGADDLAGGFGDDYFAGGAGADLIDGSAGVDTASYAASSGGVAIDFEAGTATGGEAQGDQLVSIENLIGSDLADSLAGNFLDNRLAGGFGADQLLGRDGNDTLLGGGQNDLLDGGGGVDVLSGGAGADTLLGGAGFDILHGDEGDDVLNGGTAADAMSGGTGNDTYHVDNAGDTIAELASEGDDRVVSSFSYQLGANLERLTLLGTAAINGTGNGLANYLGGNSGNNALNGLAGADTMVGKGGNDTYYVNTAGDTVVEVGGEGNDRVISSIGYVLGANVERLALAGGAAIDGTGNELANSIAGNSGNNVLNGMAGADAMAGKGGNDTYHVDNAGDTVAELAGRGTDRVVSTISYTLGANVERLALAGPASIDGTGNELANVIDGNTGNNVLSGMAGADNITGKAGNDTLSGGSGNDTLNGGTGNDIFLFADALIPENVDRIIGFSASDDTINLDDSIFGGLPAGALAAGAFNTGSSASQADDRIIYDPVTGFLLFDADGSGAGAALHFATLAPGLAISAADFVVV